MILLDRLIEKFPTAKRQTLKEMVQNRRITINGKIATRLKQPISPDDQIRIQKSPTPAPPAAQLPFEIIFQDQDIIVIDKPSGLLTSTVPREPRPTAVAILRDYLASHDPSARLGLIHRLDRDASGLLVFSKNPRAFESLKKQFFKHTVDRIYHAIVSPPPHKPAGQIESHLVEHADGTVHSTRLPNRGQRAITEYSTLKTEKTRALLRITLHTGRKHQIRAHLSESASPILGDQVYSGKPHPDGLMLRAVELHLDHPRTAKRISFKIPANFDKLFTPRSS